MHLTEAVLAPLRERYGEPRAAALGGRGEPRRSSRSPAARPERRHDVTFFVFDPRERLALIQKPSYPQGVWRPPGGGVQPGERLRERRAAGGVEELGIHIELERLPRQHARRRFRCSRRRDRLAHARLLGAHRRGAARADRHARDQRRPLGQRPRSWPARSGSACSRPAARSGATASRCTTPR